MDFRYEIINSEYTVYKFENYFDDSIYADLKLNSEKFPYFPLEGKRTDKFERLWMHKYSEFKHVCDHFDSQTTKEMFSDITRVDYTQCKTRIELCRDSKGSWLETHGDDPAKLFTFQVYLSQSSSSTNFMNLPSLAVENTGWFFNNTGTELHGLNPLPTDRTSIIVNYVNHKWRNSNVLIGG